MEWQGEGTVIARRPHGETAVIIDVLTAQHGRHAGLVPGGASRKRAAMLQPGRVWRCAGARVRTISLDISTPSPCICAPGCWPIRWVWRG